MAYFNLKVFDELYFQKKIFPAFTKKKYENFSMDALLMLNVLDHDIV
jgi:hypothetical protein